MKKIISVFTCLVFLAVMIMVGCGDSSSVNDKIKDMEFTVVEEEEIPEELLTIIEANKKGEMKMTYESEKYLYAIRGYGEQKTGGYSIAIEQCYLSPDGIKVITGLLGPSHEKTIPAEPSYPYAVIKMKYTKEPVNFE